MCLHFWHFPAIIGFTSKINIVREAPGGELILTGVFFGRRFLSIVILLKHLLYIISLYIFIAGRKEMANILIVEDDRTTIDLICDYLSDVGHSVRQAYDGKQALELFYRKPAELVILDIMLP